MLLGLFVSALCAVGGAGEPPDSTWKGATTPESVARNLVVLEVRFRTDSGTVGQGRLVCHRAVAEDLAGLFDTLFSTGFPMRSVRPVSEFGGSDSLSMLADNTSAFNWRRVRGQARLSAHALGLALDINPWRNPFAHRTGNRPRGSVRDVRVPGTLTDTSLAVRYLRSRGWIWGGRWASGRDWQHFEKPLALSRSGLAGLGPWRASATECGRGCSTEGAEERRPPSATPRRGGLISRR